MWNPLWHLRGSTLLEDAATNDEVLNRLENLLKRERKQVVQRRTDSVMFYTPLWADSFGPNWSAMVLYERGELRIEQGRQGRNLRYDLRSLHGFISCLFAAVVFFGFGIANEGVLNGLIYGLFAFGWLYGMNLLLARCRIPRTIRKALQSR